MEHNDNTFQILELMTEPVLAVHCGMIVYTNQAAKSLLIPCNISVSSLLTTGSSEYENFTDGCLSVTLKIENLTYRASVSKNGLYDIFVLDSASGNERLESLAIAARELRKPLSAIMASTRKIIDDDDRDCVQRKTQYAQINRELLQLLRTVNNMADADRYYSTRSPIKETLDITKVFDELINDISFRLADAGIRVQYTGLSKPAYSIANQELLERAVLNLFNNAGKFAGAGGTIRAQLHQHGTLFQFTIEDSGSGIPEQSMNKVFNRYSQHPTLDEGRKGLGLGLSIVCAAAHQHGGTVLFQQAENAGCKFTMTFALKQPSQTTVRAPYLSFDYAGEIDHCLLELSDILPNEIYQGTF